MAAAKAPVKAELNDWLDENESLQATLPGVPVGYLPFPAGAPGTVFSCMEATMLLLVTKIMKSDVFALAPELPVGAAVEVLIERGLDTAPVLSETGMLIGAVSLSELGLGHGAATVREVMLTTVPAVRNDSTAMEAAHFMAAGGHTWLLVVGPFGMILGVVTALDVVRALAAGLPLAPDAEVVFDRMAS